MKTEISELTGMSMAAVAAMAGGYLVLLVTGIAGLGMLTAFGLGMLVGVLVDSYNGRL